MSPKPINFNYNPTKCFLCQNATTLWHNASQNLKKKEKKKVDSCNQVDVTLTFEIKDICKFYCKKK